ncbi:hypothetical protein ACQKWADRAFT_87236 [Trichoderma austrokoningii]
MRWLFVIHVLIISFLIYYHLTLTIASSHGPQDQRRLRHNHAAAASSCNPPFPKRQTPACDILCIRLCITTCSAGRL